MARSSGRNAEPRRKKVTLTAVTLTGIVILFLAALVVNSGFLRRRVAAAEVAGIKFSPAEYNYFYISAISEHSSSSSTQPDMSKSLAGQINYETGQTWAEFFEESAFDQMRLIGSVCAEALSKGFALSEEQKRELEESRTSEREQVEMYYAQNGGFKGYLKQQFGVGMTEKVYDKLTDMRFMAGKYSESVYDGFEYTDERLAEYYAENKDALDTFVYRSFVVNVEEPDYETDAETAEGAAYDEARGKANGYAAAVTDESSFIEAAREYDAFTYAEDDSTLRNSLGENLEYSLSAAAADWLKSGGAKPGDVTSMPISEDEETNTGFYVVYFTERSANDYMTVNFRELSVTPSTPDSAGFTDEEGNYDEEGYNAALETAAADAKKKAEELYAQFSEGGATEEKLTELTEDVFNEVTGDRYDNIQRDAGVDKYIEEWLYDGNRAEGDHTLIKTDDGNWHIVYFAGDGKMYNDHLADTRLRGEEFTAWQESFDANEVKTYWAMKLK
ncbi:MAG: hypothetical protein LBD49_01645 [Oscillospiraceae bacterium]|jgi:hypothetical protein|nr:hypothetical protein [Oscillospiraceae bacterium]